VSVYLHLIKALFLWRSEFAAKRVTVHGRLSTFSSQFLPARRYALVYYNLRHGVCLSVTSLEAVVMEGGIELVFATEATLGLSFNVFKMEFWLSPKMRTLR